MRKRMSTTIKIVPNKGFLYCSVDARGQSLGADGLCSLGALGADVLDDRAKMRANPKMPAVHGNLMSFLLRKSVIKDNLFLLASDCRPLSRPVPELAVRIFVMSMVHPLAIFMFFHLARRHGILAPARFLSLGPSWRLLKIRGLDLVKTPRDVLDTLPRTLKVLALIPFTIMLIVISLPIAEQVGIGIGGVLHSWCSRDGGPLRSEIGRERWRKFTLVALARVIPLVLTYLRNEIVEQLGKWVRIWGGMIVIVGLTESGTCPQTVVSSPTPTHQQEG
jgi:hypothetical protein